MDVIQTFAVDKQLNTIKMAVTVGVSGTHNVPCSENG